MPTAVPKTTKEPVPKTTKEPTKAHNQQLNLIWRSNDRFGIKELATITSNSYFIYFT